MVLPTDQRPPGKGKRMNVKFASVLALALGALFLLPSCSTPRSQIEKAEQGGRHDRKEALASLARSAQEGRLDNLSPEWRERLSRYVTDRFPVEQNPTLRAQLIAIALDASLDSAPQLLAEGFDDPELAVRLQSVERIGSIAPVDRRERLRRRLLEDSDTLVQIAAARAYREQGTEAWAKELVEVIVNPRFDENVRFQAYLSAVALTGADLMFLPEDWRAWLEENGS